MDVMEICAFCGRKVKKTEGTSVTDNYCIECHRLTIRESRDAIRRMQGKPPLKDRSSVNDDALREAFNNLTRNSKSFDTEVLFEDKSHKSNT